jgi:hypothetical protein
MKLLPLATLTLMKLLPLATTLTLTPTLATLLNLSALDVEE